MRTIAIIAVCAASIASAASAAFPVTDEEKMGRAEAALVFTAPIAGIENSRWFDYRGNVNETQKELASDLRRASDMEDLRDAWEEYAHELKHERIDYIEDMAEKGYRAGTVTLVH